MKYCDLRLPTGLSSAHSMGGIPVYWYELCMVMHFARNIRQDLIYIWNSLFLVSLHLGVHPSTGSFQAEELLQSLGA